MYVGEVGSVHKVGSGHLRKGNEWWDEEIKMSVKERKKKKKVFWWYF